MIFLPKIFGQNCVQEEIRVQKPKFSVAVRRTQNVWQHILPTLLFETQSGNLPQAQPNLFLFLPVSHLSPDHIAGLRPLMHSQGWKFTQGNCPNSCWIIFFGKLETENKAEKQIFYWVCFPPFLPVFAVKEIQTPQNETKMAKVSKKHINFNMDVNTPKQ